MNVVSDRSSTSRERPASIRSDIRCLNSGAVNRSISPVTPTTCVSSSTFLSNLELDRHRPRSPTRPGAGSRRSWPRRPAGRAGTHRVLGGHAELVGELLDHVADPGDRGVDDQRFPTAGAQRADAQRERARAGLERDVDAAAGHVRGRAPRSGRRRARRRRGGRAGGRRGRPASRPRAAARGRRAARPRSTRWSAARRRPGGPSSREPQRPAQERHPSASRSSAPARSRAGARAATPRWRTRSRSSGRRAPAGCCGWISCAGL